MESCLEIVNHLIKGRIKVHKDLQNVSIKGNVGKLHQVFTNLLTNAAQAIKGEGEFHLSIKKEANNVFVRIQDSGSGISPENLKKIQEPFFTNKPPGEGTGLGLSITKRIVEEHQGQLHFESEPGQGTTVQIRFPYYTPN